VRTEASGAKQHGITWAICDMHAKGIDVRPIQTIAGDWHFCEVFYDDVRIPLANVVGNINEGWDVAQSTLSFERGTGLVGVQVEISAMLEQLIALAHDRVGPDGLRAAIKDEIFAHRMAVAKAETRAMRAMTYALISRLEKGGNAGAEASIIRLYSMELYKRVAQLALDLMGPEAVIMEPSGPRWPFLFLESFKQTIGGGTSEIQRNIIGERVLGLPRGK
jgi:alkylation response protein AidB-like acyl-CoA dehydrogenase